MGIIKRPYPSDGKCEICDLQAKKLSYHHWNEQYPSWGIWMCHSCHSGCNFYEKSGLVQKYIALRDQVQLTHNPDVSSAPLGIGKGTEKILAAAKSKATRRQY